MKCSEVQKLLSASFDGELGEGHEGVLNEHLAECGVCQIFATDLAQCASALNTLTVPNVRSGFTNSVMACIPKAKTERACWRKRLAQANPIRVGFGAMGLACGIALAFLTFDATDTSTGGSTTSEPKEAVYSEVFVAMPMESVGGRYLALTQRRGK